MGELRAVDIVEAHLRRALGTHAPGARLPAVRDLVQELRVGPVTVNRAMNRLVAQGLVVSRPGQGTFVARHHADAGAREAAGDLAWQSLALGARRVPVDAMGSVVATAAQPETDREVAQLSNGYLPSELQAGSLLDAAATRALKRSGIWHRLPPEGIASLRAWFTRATGDAFRAHEVMILPGTQPGLGTIFRALTSEHDAILMESPTYTGAIACAREQGLRLVPVPTDRHGVRCEALEEAFRTTGARVFYAQPTFANPTGAVLAPQRRAALLQVLRRNNAFMIEDDWARDLSIDGDAPPPMAAESHEGHIIYLRSLTKCAAPGLRIGAVCARGPALERLRGTRVVDDFFVPGLLQETAFELVAHPAWHRHLRQLRGALRQRRDALVAALREHVGPHSVDNVPAGGLHVWARLPDGVDDRLLAQRAAGDGILVSAGTQWFPAEATGSFLRLSFASVPPHRYDAVIRRLASMLPELSRHLGASLQG